MLQQAACTAADRHQWLEVVTVESTEIPQPSSAVCAEESVCKRLPNTCNCAVSGKKSTKSSDTLAVQNASMAQKQPGSSKALIQPSTKTQVWPTARSPVE